MRRVVTFSVLMAAATSWVVAAPPYEPLPSSTSSSSSYGSSSSSSGGSAASSQTPATTYGSGVKTYGIGGSGSDVSYPAAVDASRQSSSSGTSTTPSWDSYSQMQQMQQDLQNLRGQVEQMTHELETMRKQERERYLDLDLRINQLRSGGAAATNPDEPVAAGSQAVGSDQVAQDKDAYDKASQLRRDSKFSESIAMMEDLLKRSPGGPYAPYCEYWLGEMYMVLTPPKMDVAKGHFISLIASYPDHVKVPDAMYKLGKLFALQGEADKAKSTLNALIKKYPNKSAAKLGRDLLKTL